MGALFGYSGTPDSALTRAMSETLAHRGRMGASTAASPSGTLGYRRRYDAATERRLNVGVFESRDLALALAGHVNFDPRLHDPPFSDLAALADLYREYGTGFLESLDGAFVLALRDRDTLLLARDGSGERTLYYGCAGGRLLFASEPKAVLAAPVFPRRLRPAALAEYLTFSFLPGSGTMLEDLHELKPGHFIRFDGQSAGPQTPYFDPHADLGGPDLSDEAWIDRFRAEMRREVETRVPPGEPVGVFLSGGIDSSVVTAEVARSREHPIRTWAIHFGSGYPNELEFAAAVARRCGTDHEEILVRPNDFVPRLRQIVWHLDDPIGDPVAMPNFELARHASREVRWIFNGEGGDPCFGGPKNLPMMLHHWYGGIDRSRDFRERAYLQSYQRAFEEIERLLTPDFRSRIDKGPGLASHLTPFFSATRPHRFLDKLTTINIRLKGAHLILPKVERMTGAWQLTPVAPLFSNRMVRLSFAIPPHLKLHGGVEKVILKRAYADTLPPEVIARPKSGMRVPVHYWFQGEMKRYARSILSPRNLKRVGIFNPDRVKQLLDYDTEEGPGRYGLRLWMLITFEIWRRIFVEGEEL